MTKFTLTEQVEICQRLNKIKALAKEVFDIAGKDRCDGKYNEDFGIVPNPAYEQGMTPNEEPFLSVGHLLSVEIRLHAPLLRKDNSKSRPGRNGIMGGK